MSYHRSVDGCELSNADVMEWFKRNPSREFQLSFVDPPFNQGKDYKFFDDNLPHEEYWEWMDKILQEIFNRTVDGGAVYFIQREKNTEFVLNTLRKAGWSFQNLIIWKKKTSAVPVANRFGKQFQVIACAIKGEKPRIFNRLRISPPLPPEYRYEREAGVFLTDIWDDIRELTLGYFAGDEAIRTEDGGRFHKQQSPVALLLRIIMSSSSVGDTVFDPFAGTGTTLVVAKQLKRNSIGIDIDPENVKLIRRRLKEERKSDDVSKYFDYYRYTDGLASIVGTEEGSRKFSANFEQAAI